MSYRIDIMTLFPDTMSAVLHESILGRAARRGLLDINCVQIRDYTENKQMQVDDYPYGGGWGQIMMAQPLKSCLDHIREEAGERKARVIYMSPQGAPFTQEVARRLLRDYDQLVLVCGHYEGVDERFIEECVDEEISLGDFVLTGGEIAAMAVCDCVCRMVPGVLSDEECFTGESHWDGLLEYPQYTRPEAWEGRRVPEVLLSGDHARVESWRRKKCLERTMDKRPDMFEKLRISSKEYKKLLEEIQKERTPMTLQYVFDCRKAAPGDVDAIMTLAADASAYLRSQGVDQWQDGYPQRERIMEDVEAGRGWLFTMGGEAAGYCCILLDHEPDYDSIDGAWRTDGESYGVIHRAMITAKYRGSSLASDMFSLAEDLSAGTGRTSVRVDTHPDNGPMHSLVKRLGYEYCGVILVRVAPGHEPRRHAFEKLL